MYGAVAFGFVCAVGLTPVVGAAFVASLFRRRDRLAGLAPIAAVAGFITGGVTGWALVPPQWTSSFWTTLDAATNAAGYGAEFEHTAEHALMYFFYPAELGAIIAGIVALALLWRLPVPPAAVPMRRTMV